MAGEEIVSTRCGAFAPPINPLARSRRPSGSGPRRRRIHWTLSHNRRINLASSQSPLHVLVHFQPWLFGRG